MNRIKNKTALITGATSGIGEACAKALAREKVNIVLIGRRKERFLDWASELEIKHEIIVKSIALDVRKPKDVEEKLSFLLKSNTIDILINSAGLALGLEKIDEGLIDDWEEMIDTNIKGLLYVSRMVIPHFREKNSGHIVNLGSMAGVFTYPNGNVYCATKAAVHALSEAMNLDLTGTDIRISNIAPGAVRTEFSNVRFHGNDEKANAVYKGFKPLSAKDIADLIVYVLNTPRHVNIQHLLVMPTAQRNPYLLNKSKVKKIKI